jgi:hypothetical protein
MKVVIEIYQGKVVNVVTNEIVDDIEFFVEDQDDAKYTSPHVIVDPSACETSRQLAKLTALHMQREKERG